MKLLADESIEREIVAALRMAGHEVEDIKELRPGIEDAEVLSIAESSNAILITNDKDFGALVHRDKLVSSGIILLRFGHTPMTERIGHLEEALAEHGDQLVSAFAVITNRGVRIRK